MGGTNRQGGISIGVPSLKGFTPERERRQGFRAVGVAVSKVAVPVVAKRGGGILVRLKTDWAAIIGQDWAYVTWPMALGRDGVLKVLATSYAALEAQHRAPLLIERINVFFGRPVITRLALMQGPLPLVSPPNVPSLRTLAPGEVRALNQQVAEIADPALRDALVRLGRAVMGAKR